MYSTSLTTWARSIGIDATLIGFLIAGTFFSVPHVLQVSVFFLWWISILGICASLFLLLAPSHIERSIDELKTKIGLMRALGADDEDMAEQVAKVRKLQESHKKMWSAKTSERLAFSRTFLVYRWFTNIAVCVLLLMAGHPVLATIKATSFLLGCILVSVARRTYRNHKGLDGEADSDTPV